LQCGGNTLLVQLVHGYLALKPSNTSHLVIQIQRAVLVWHGSTLKVSR